MNIEDYSTEELRAELKKRSAEEKAKKESILRCRMCKHWGKITYWGTPVDYGYGNSLPCKFWKTKNGKYYRFHNASEPACEHFERKKDSYVNN